MGRGKRPCALRGAAHALSALSMNLWHGCPSFTLSRGTGSCKDIPGAALSSVARSAPAFRARSAWRAAHGRAAHGRAVSRLGLSCASC